MTDRVLVAYGSKMGSTAEIAEEVARVLREEGCEVEIREASHAAGVESYDGVVIGSAVYMARWRPEVVRFMKRERKGLAAMPVWLFHDGPLDHEPEHAVQPLPKEVEAIAMLIGIQDAATFGGKLDEHPSGFIAKSMAKRMAGDFRDWDQIRSWAQGVARELHALRTGKQRTA
jgi:menaquinone-dependent protoporphyrinogen oxidase